MNRRAFLLGTVCAPFIAAAKVPPRPDVVRIPFSTLPWNHYIRGPRRTIQFDRIVTPRIAQPS